MATILQEELDRYNSYGHCWHGSNRPKFLSILEQSTTLRMDFIRETILKNSLMGTQLRSPRSMLTSRFRSDRLPSRHWDNLRGINVLDVGCGGGYISEALAKCGANVIAIDISSTVIKENKERQATHPNNSIRSNIKYLETDVDSLAHAKAPTSLIETILKWLGPSDYHGVLPEKGFDVVVASEVIEHVDRPRLFLNSIDRLLKPSGVLVITAPNRTIFSRLAFITLAESLIRIIPKGTHVWGRFIKPAEIETFLDNRPFVNKKSPLVPRGDDDVINKNRYQLIHRGGFFFVPVVNRWFRCKRFEGLGYMLSFKKLATTNTPPVNSATR